MKTKPKDNDVRLVASLANVGTSLNGKLTLIALGLLAIIIGFAGIMLYNSLSTNRTMGMLNGYRTAELRLTSDYHISLQRWMTEVIAYAASGEEEEYEEAMETLERLDTVLAAWYALKETKPPGAIEGDEHNDLLNQQNNLVAQARQLSEQIGSGDRVDVNEVQEEIERLEEWRETLALEANSYINELQVQMEHRGRQALQTVLATVGGVFTSVLFLIGGIFWLMHRRVVRPIKRLAVAAEAVARGDLSQAVAINSRDEIGVLQSRFNKMVTTIQLQTSELENKHQQAMLARDEAETARNQTMEQLTIIQEQQRTIQELGVPLLPLSDTALVMPLVGSIDTRRAQQMMAALLDGIAQHHSTIAIVDITGVQVIDTQVAQAFIQMAQAVKLLGAQVVLTGIQPQIAQTLVELGIDMRGIVTRSTLQAGIAYALSGAHTRAA